MSRSWKVIPLLLAPMAQGQSSELATLRKRCTEQERQIRDLETENARLRAELGAQETAPAPSPDPSWTSQAASLISDLAVERLDERPVASASLIDISAAATPDQSRRSSNTSQTTA